MKRDSDRSSSDRIDELARRFAESLPASLRSMREELEQNFRSVLRSGLERLDLVTREEFEVQQLVLARTREKLDALSKRLERLEKSAPTSKEPPAKRTADQKTAAERVGRGGRPGGGTDEADR